MTPATDSLAERVRPRDGHPKPKTVSTLGRVRMNKDVAGLARRNLWLLSALGAGLSIFGCECDGGPPPLTRLSAQIVVYDPGLENQPEINEIDFGAVPLGVPYLRAVGVRNIGDDTLRVCLAGATDTDCTEASRVQPDNAPFTPQFDNPSETGAWVVERGTDREFTLTFHPTVEGDVSATLILVHNAANGPSTIITLKGSGVQPQIDLSTDTLDFGQVTVDQRKELEVVLTNRTQFTQPFRIDPLAQSAVIFGVTDAGGVPPPASDQPLTGDVPGNGTTTVKVWFQPLEEGPAMNTLNLSYCDTCTKQISLRGEGIKPLFELVPVSLDFGTLEEGQSATQSFIVRNVGNVPLTVFSVGIDRNTTPEFSTNPAVSLPAALMPTEELSVDVMYLGTTPGDDSGNVEVDTNAWDDPNTPISETIGLVALTATSRGPDINPFPPAVNFGTVGIMGTPVTRILSIQNVGNAPLTVSGIALNVATAEITMDPPPATPFTIDPGASIDLRLNYGPQDAGMDTGTVLVTSDDRDEGMLSIPLAGIGGVPTTCSLSVAPSQVTFGLVERGRVATLPVEIRNSGAQPCNVSNIALNGDAEFRISAGGGGGPVNIVPGGTQRIDVEYAPTAYGMHSTLLEFDSDDPAQMHGQVPITGASEQSTVLVIPSQLDFNVVPVTCRSPNRVVTVYNTGASPVQIDNVFLDPTTTPEFELTPFPTPQTVAAGGSTVINLRYHPTDIGPDTGVLFISHSANLNPVAVPLSGEGQISPTVTDRFQQLPNPLADVLFVVDNSCSMDQEQANLGSNLGAFLAFAQSQGIDYQIAVTTTDVDPGGEDGRFVGTTRIITPATPNASTVFQQNVNRGTGGSGIEQGFAASYLALSDPLINTWNAGFLRPDASLAVIYVSDEIDQSPQASSFYENFLRNIKGFANSTLFSASAVVGTTNPVCNGPGGSAEYAPNYISVANNTGGVVESICAANWGQTLANIGLNSFGLKRQFTLSSQPVPVTIAVSVDGAQIPSTTAGGQVNWTYDMGTNSVVFSASAVPQANSTIEITYTVACLP